MNINRLFYVLFAIVSFLVFSSCVVKTEAAKGISQKTDTIHFDRKKTKVANSLLCKKNTIFRVDDEIDLNGKTYEIPEGVTLIAGKGVIRNGVLKGRGTKIDGKGILFDNIVISGSWSVKNIYSSFFKSHNRINTLKSIFAMASSRIQNTIFIEKGEYFVSTDSYKPALSVPSNTTVIINGTISLVENDYRGCSVLGLENVYDINIKGNGIVIGDRKKHLGIKGEWGHGVNIMKSSNISISGLKITQCWGDCIYIGGKSKDVIISDCDISYGRRQGVSITSAMNVTINNCIISNVKGTPPEYAIDIEPNKNDTIMNVIINEVSVDNCKGGLMATGGASGKRFIANVHFHKCKISNTQNAPINIQGVNNAIVDKCSIENKKHKYAMYVSRSTNTTVTNNIITSSNYVLNETRDIKFRNNKILKGDLVPSQTEKFINSIFK